RDGVRQCGGDRGDADLADSGRWLGRVDQVHLDPRDRTHPQTWIGVEVLGDEVAALAEADLAPRCRAQPPEQPALHLRADQVRVDDSPTVEREHDPADVDPAAVVERDLRDLRAMAEEARAGDPAGATLGEQRSPAGALGGELERAYRARTVGEELAPQVDRVAAGRDRELVDRRLASELGMGVADRSPNHDRNPRLEV